MVTQNSADFPVFRGPAGQFGRGFGALAQTLGRTAIRFIKKMYSSSCETIWGQICLKSLLQRLGKFLVDIKNSKHLQKMWVQKQFGNNWDVEKRNLSVEQEEPFLAKVDQRAVALAETFLTI